MGQNQGKAQDPQQAGAPMAQSFVQLEGDVDRANQLSKERGVASLSFEAICRLPDSTAFVWRAFSAVEMRQGTDQAKMLTLRQFYVLAQKLQMCAGESTLPPPDP